MARRRRGRFASEAALEALVRFGPELSGLRELTRQAKENYSTAVQQAHGTARGTIGAIDRARPEVKGIYDKAGLDEARTASLVGGDIAALPGVANSIRAGAQLEASHAAGALRDAQAAALTDLSSRRVAAREGETFAVNNAHSQLVDALTKVLSRSQDLAQERGAFTALTTRQLRREAQQEATKVKIASGRNTQAERNSLRSAGIDPDTGKAIPNGKLDPRAKAKSGPKGQTRGGATREALSRAGDEIGRLGGEIRTLKQSGAGRHEIAQILLNGAKETPLYDPKTGKRQVDKGGKQRTIPGIDKAKSQLLLSVALDVAFDGHVSRANHRRLLDRGLSIRDLGLPSYGDWKRKQARSRPRYRPVNAQADPRFGAH